ncbi:MAG: glutamate--tRNA ligase [Patescibacteria group bacterium]
MPEQRVVTRFAPSPTGYLHVGGARTALYAWLWSRKHGGEFHLRIEDTDRQRFMADAEEQIKDSLQWLGLDWDGPILRQSERLEKYRLYAEQLIKDGHAYVSDESPEETKALKEQWRNTAAKNGQPLRYRGRDRDLSYEPGRHVHFRWPDEPKRMVITYFEHPRKPWKVSVDPKAAPSAFEDFVLVKSDGYPTYNFAHIIDDKETGVTAVIRGDEFTSSLNKYYALYDALGWGRERPAFYHVPTILGPDKAKLSKRHGAADVRDYRAAGYLPEALANFVALIGWNPGGDREVFLDLKELMEVFDLSGVQRSPGVFDEEKLRWLNGEHIKALGVEALFRRAVAAGFWTVGDAAYDERVLGMSAERIRTLAELKGIREGYFYHRPKVTRKRLVGSENPQTVGVWLERVLRDLSGLPDVDWNAQRIENVLNDLRNELDLEPKQLYPVLRIAATDADRTPPLWDLFETLGKEETVARLDAAQSLVA